MASEEKQSSQLWEIRKSQIGQMRRYPKDKIEILKIFLQFLYSLSYNELWLFFVSFVPSWWDFFEPNAQLRPIIEGRCFSAPQAL